ncbi:MAG TPA: DUF5684 domain-containing protein [Phycisphaerales bacterium]|nr:DUF5684 domain-containing protein [Phycisphaerales bacterium]
MHGMLQMLAQSDGQGGGLFGTVIWLAVFGAILASFWKVFEKAGHEGWKGIVPILNCYYLCKIAGRPGWWTALLLVPFINFLVLAVLSIDVAKAFGKSAGFGVGLWLLGFVFYPILAFGSAEYQGPRGGNPEGHAEGERALAA